MENKEEKKQETLSIDISKIPNINTLQENPSVKDVIDKTSKKEEKVEKTIKKPYEQELFTKYPRKFDFVQPSKILLPSRGVCYKDIDDPDLKEGYIWIYPLTMKEEEILSTPRYIYDGVATIMALNNCIKSNISAIDLVVSDFYYLLLYLRKISISDKFSFKVTCDHCGNTFDYDINIADINYEFDEKIYKEPIRIDLDKTGYTVLLCIPRIKNIRELSSLISESENSDIGIAEFLYTRTFAIIGPNGEEVNKEDWIVFYNNLPHEDSDRLLKAAEFDNGLSNIVKEAVCPKCGESVGGTSVDLNTDALFRF